VLSRALRTVVEDLGVAEDLEVLAVAAQVVGAGLQRDLHEAVLGDVLGLDEEQAP
jgi:hypothetical protein